MSEYLGFAPTTEEEFYFLSYNSEDVSRVGAIVRELHDRIPIWYDYGIPYGDEWEACISKKLAECKAVLLFFSRGIFGKDDSYVQKEFKIAKRLQKKIYVAVIDPIEDRDVPGEKMAFWVDVTESQNIEAGPEYSPSQIADMIYSSLMNQVVQVENKLQIVTEEMLEPEIELHIRELPQSRSPFGRKTVKAELAAIRQENKAELKTLRDRLQQITAEQTPDSVEAYRCAREVMIKVKDQLGAYDWEYKLDQRIADFAVDYEKNLVGIRQALLQGHTMLSSGQLNQLKQIIYGLDGVIELL